MMAHNPAPTIVTVAGPTPFTTVHDAGLSDENSTGRPELALALISNGAPPNVRSPSGRNVIVWLFFATEVTAVETLLAGVGSLASDTTKAVLNTTAGVTRLVEA